MTCGWKKRTKLFHHRLQIDRMKFQRNSLTSPAIDVAVWSRQIITDTMLRKFRLRYKSIGMCDILCVNGIFIHLRGMNS